MSPASLSVIVGISPVISRISSDGIGTVRCAILLSTPLPSDGIITSFAFYQQDADSGAEFQTWRFLPSSNSYTLVGRFATAVSAGAQTISIKTTSRWKSQAGDFIGYCHSGSSSGITYTMVDSSPTLLSSSISTHGAVLARSSFTVVQRTFSLIANMARSKNTEQQECRKRRGTEKKNITICSSHISHSCHLLTPCLVSVVLSSLLFSVSPLSCNLSSLVLPLNAAIGTCGRSSLLINQTCSITCPTGSTLTGSIYHCGIDGGLTGNQGCIRSMGWSVLSTPSFLVGRTGTNFLIRNNVLLAMAGIQGAYKNGEDYKNECFVFPP